MPASASRPTVSCSHGPRTNPKSIHGVGAANSDNLVVCCGSYSVGCDSCQTLIRPVGGGEPTLEVSEDVGLLRVPGPPEDFDAIVEGLITEGAGGVARMLVRNFSEVLVSLATPEGHRAQPMLRAGIARIMQTAARDRDERLRGWIQVAGRRARDLEISHNDAFNALAVDAPPQFSRNERVLAVHESTPTTTLENGGVRFPACPCVVLRYDSLLIATSRPFGRTSR